MVSWCINYRYGFNDDWTLRSKFDPVDQISEGTAANLLQRVEFWEWGSNTHYDYGARIYNPAIAKFLSVDPLTKDYPELTPCQFASNTPIQAIDLDGLEAFFLAGAGGHAIGRLNSKTQT